MNEDLGEKLCCRMSNWATTVTSCNARTPVDLADSGVVNRPAFTLLHLLCARRLTTMQLVTFDERFTPEIESGMFTPVECDCQQSDDKSENADRGAACN